jgi:hypothetical protein
MKIVLKTSKNLKRRLNDQPGARRHSLLRCSEDILPGYLSEDCHPLSHYKVKGD